MNRCRADAPDGVDGSLFVGEGMISIKSQTDSRPTNSSAVVHGELPVSALGQKE